jgi:hypothetical protein
MFPDEIMTILDTGFMGFKVWHLLIVALIIPSPLMFVVLLLLIPGFKEKVIELVRNGGSLSTIYSGVPGVTGEVGQGYAEGATQGSSKA